MPKAINSILMPLTDILTRLVFASCILETARASTIFVFQFKVISKTKWTIKNVGALLKRSKISKLHCDDAQMKARAELL